MTKGIQNLASSLCLLIAGQAIAQHAAYIKAGQLVDVVDGRLRADQTIVMKGGEIHKR